jgi:hypothetical protein
MLLSFVTGLFVVSAYAYAFPSSRGSSLGGADIFLAFLGFVGLGGLLFDDHVVVFHIVLLSRGGRDSPSLNAF